MREEECKVSIPMKMEIKKAIEMRRLRTGVQDLIVTITCVGGGVVGRDGIKVHSHGAAVATLVLVFFIALLLKVFT